MNLYNINTTDILIYYHHIIMDIKSKTANSTINFEALAPYNSINDIQFNICNTNMTQNIYTCKYCNKHFKKLVVKDKHEYEQICIPITKKTYCKVCNWTAENTYTYNEHLMSREHLNKIGRMSVNDLNVVISNPIRDKINIMNACDPVLSQCEQHTMTNNTHHIKLFHNDGGIMQVDTNNTNNTLYELSLSDVDKAVRTVEVANGGTIKYQDLVEKERGMAKMTTRQEKIIEYLCKFQKNDAKEMIERFKIILDKIGMDDADFLGTHIRNYPGLSINAKQIYGAYLEKFINVLMRMVMTGEKTYRDMDIFEFVAKLTK